jgi:hypothetical protein
MADRESDLSRLLREEDREAEVQRELEQRHRQIRDEVEQNAPGNWHTAKAALKEAIEQFNSDFERHGRPNRFKYADLPQPGQGNIAAGMITHSSSRIPPELSQTTVACSISGGIVFSYQGLTRNFKTTHRAEEMDKTAWAAAMLPIYRADA